jgi:hypothetical protein
MNLLHKEYVEVIIKWCFGDTNVRNKLFSKSEDYLLHQNSADTLGRSKIR